MDPLRISMVGLSQFESVFVETTVDLASGIDIAPCRLVNDPDTADVLFVDKGDRIPPRSNGENGPIVVSFSGESVAPGRGLTRPVSYGDLVSVLKEIEAELSEAAEILSTEPAASDEPDAPESTSESEAALQSPLPRIDESLAGKARPARRFVEGTRFIGLLKRIFDIARPAEISHAEFPRVMVFPDDHAYSTPAESLAIPAMFRSSVLEFQVRPIGEDAVREALASDRCLPLGWLVYGASLFGSEGRLLLGADPDDELKLADWPDFDAVPHLPEHRAIARFMLVHSATLADIAAATGVSMYKVIDFCNACEAAGLVQRTPLKPDKLADRMRDLFNT